MKKAIDFLHQVNPLSEALRIYLYETMRSESLRKKVKLLRSGHICRHIYFVEKGLFRCYVRRGDKEICKWFMREGDVIISVNSFFNQVPAQETIESLEDSEVHSITYAELQTIYEKFPEFRRTGQWLTQQYYCQSELRADDLRMKPSEELYEDFIRDHPELNGRISDTHLSSYLGITIQTLMRIKRMRRPH
jgi:CRP-like cAMP-binding protein